MNKNNLTIKEAADFLDISIDTLRRWDKNGQLKSSRTGKSQHRRYDLATLEEFQISHCRELANKWVKRGTGTIPSGLFYCPDSYVFQGRLSKLKTGLEKARIDTAIMPLLIAMAGEIGDNSFAHNLGNWPDATGIFFGWNTASREIVLADRGLGVLKTLRRVKPALADDQEALRVAFTEIVSGRSPENRGNGLKFVRILTENNPIGLCFKSGTAELTLAAFKKELNICKAKQPIKGCLAVISF